MARFEKKRILCLPFYEGESFLAVPDFASWYIEASTEKTVPASEVAGWIVQAARHYIPQMATSTKAFLEYRYHSKLEFKHDSVVGVTGTTAVALPDTVTDFEARIKRMVDAVNNHDTLEILTVFSGKYLYKGLCSEFRQTHGVSLSNDPAQHYRNIMNIPGFRTKLNAIPFVSDLKKRVEQALSR